MFSRKNKKIKGNLVFPLSHVHIESELSLEQLGEIISDGIFCGIPFEKTDLKIFGETPTLFIGHLLGLHFFLHGYPQSSDPIGGYALSIVSAKNNTSGTSPVSLATYMTELCKEYLKDLPAGASL